MEKSMVNESVVKSREIDGKTRWLAPFTHGKIREIHGS